MRPRGTRDATPPPNRCVAGPRRMSMRRWPEGASACTRSDGKGVPRGTVVSRASTPGEAGLTKAFATRPMSRPGVSHPTSAGGGDILSLRPGVRDANPPQSWRGLPALHAAQSVAGCRHPGKAERSFSLQPEAKRDANPPVLRWLAHAGRSKYDLGRRWATFARPYCLNQGVKRPNMDDDM